MFFLIREDIPLQEEMARREQYPHVSDNPPQTFFISGAEDVVLHKLYWLRLGVLQVQYETLGFKYLNGALLTAEFLNY